MQPKSHRDEDWLASWDTGWGEQPHNYIRNWQTRSSAISAVCEPFTHCFNVRTLQPPKLDFQKHLHSGLFLKIFMGCWLFYEITPSSSIRDLYSPVIPFPGRKWDWSHTWVVKRHKTKQRKTMCCRITSRIQCSVVGGSFHRIIGKKGI